MRYAIFLPIAALAVVFASGCGDDVDDDGSAGGGGTTAVTSASSNSAGGGTSTTNGAGGAATGAGGSSNSTSGAGGSQNGAGGSATSSSSSSSGAGGNADCGIPLTGGGQLQAFLDAGSYTSWNSESAPHDSNGPHFGDVRTYVNDTLFDALTAGSTNHPRCSASVKELYGSGNTVQGFAVFIKLQENSANGQGWYWYETYQGTTYADGPGKSLCTNCHSSGNDFVRSPFPLQ